MDLRSEHVDYCWRCNGDGGEVFGDDWIPCPACNGGEFALPQWFRQWRQRVSDPLAREDWMALRLMDSIRIWATWRRGAAGGMHGVSILRPDGADRIWVTPYHDVLQCSCDVFRLAGMCLHIPAQEWVRRSLQSCEHIAPLTADPFGGTMAFAVLTDKPVWGKRLAVRWEERRNPGWYVLCYDRNATPYTFPTVQKWVDEVITSHILEEVSQ